jgi:hypothetical protein
MSEIIEDGINILNTIDAQGSKYFLGKKDPNTDPELQIDAKKQDGKKATKMTQDGITFWRIISRKGKFASTGKDNWTSRTHIVITESNGTPIIGIKKAKQKGFLVSPKDFRDLEFTVICRINDIKDNDETFSLKIRGGPHVKKKEHTLCCEGMVPYLSEREKLYSREMTHPDYEFEKVDMMGEFPKRGEKWIGLKLISYNTTFHNHPGVHMEMYVDNDPLDQNGQPRNKWAKMWSFTDENSNAPTWGGKYETLRVDMCESVDITHINCVSIKQA